MNLKYPWIVVGLLLPLMSAMASQSALKPYDFSGFYSGGSELVKNTATAPLYDGHVGYGHYFNQNMYLGAKTSMTPSWLPTLNDIEKPIYHVDAVFGFQSSTDLLPFLEAGVSFADADDFSSNNVSRRIMGKHAIYANLLNTNQYQTGYNFGIGANYQLKKNWFLSSELIYHYLGHDIMNDASKTSNVAASSLDASTKVSQSVSVMARVSYLFPSY